VSFARSGRQLLSTGFDFTVRRWKFDFPRPRDDSYPVNQSFSMNTVSRLAFLRPREKTGKTLAVLTNYPSCLSLIDVATGKSETLRQDDSAWHICLTASGHRPEAIAIAGRGAGAGALPGSLEIWNAASGHMTWKVPVDPQRFCCAAAFSRTGQYLASSHFRGLRFKDPTVCLWDVEKKSLVKCFSGSLASALAFSPDDQYLLLAGDNWGIGAVRILHVDSGETIAKLSVHNDLVSWIGFAPSQRLFAAIDKQGGFVVWRWPSREVVLSRDRDQVSSGSGVFSPDDKLLAVACRDLVEFWRIDSGRKIGEVTFPGIVSSIAFADSGDLLAVATTRGSVHLVKSSGTTQLLRDSPDSANP
jgi:WD40 repeat protein